MLDSSKARNATASLVLALLIARNDSQFLPCSPICLLCVAAAFSAGGIAMFKRKDIK